MEYFLIGDVHGCYHTVTTLLKNWNPETQILIQVGDLVDRGNFSRNTVALFKELEASSENVIVLKGNHEILATLHHENDGNDIWWRHGGEETYGEYKDDESQFATDIEWFKQRPLIYQTQHLFVSHAGLSDRSIAEVEENRDSVVWNRKPLLLLDQVQVHGHTPHKSVQPQYEESSNSWNIDTAACYGNGLTALILNKQGAYIDHLFEATDIKDLGKFR